MTPISPLPSNRVLNVVHSIHGIGTTDLVVVSLDFRGFFVFCHLGVIVGLAIDLGVERGRIYVDGRGKS